MNGELNRALPMMKRMVAQTLFFWGLQQFTHDHFKFTTAEENDGLGGSVGAALLDRSPPSGDQSKSKGHHDVFNFSTVDENTGGRDSWRAADRIQFGSRGRSPSQDAHFQKSPGLLKVPVRAVVPTAACSVSEQCPLVDFHGMLFYCGGEKCLEENPV